MDGKQLYLSNWGYFINSQFFDENELKKDIILGNEFDPL